MNGTANMRFHFSIVQLSIGFKYGKMKYSCRTTLL